MMVDCVVLTDRRYLKDSKDPYKHNVYHEDFLVTEALKKTGLKVTRKAWDNPKMDWSETKCVLFRSTWDYFDRFNEFSNWLNTITEQTVLINSASIIRWNLDKHYLNDLRASGIAIPETQFIEKGSQLTLLEWHQKCNWRETVLKPCISGAGRHTYKLDMNNLISYEALFEELVSQEAMMLQSFQHDIVSKGEVSLMLFNGTFTHAILKKAKTGDFWVQDDFGGTVHPYKPSKKEIIFAKEAIKACPEMPTYARVDMIIDNNGDLAISELELIEPELWFRFHPEASNLLAEVVKNRLDNF